MKSRHSFGLGQLAVTAIVGLAFVSRLASAQGVQISDEQINTVSARLAESADASWELGTRAQAILELNAPRYSVFDTSGDPSLPPPHDIPSDISDGMKPAWEMAASIMRDWDGTGDGQPQPLMPDGSAADPASNGITMLLANWTGQQVPDSVNQGVGYATAAKSQLDFLCSDNVPKTPDGAISHRTKEVQLWSDYVYMVPPFLAYYGVLSGNRTLLEEAYNQCKLYRHYLRDEKSGLWRHVLLGDSGNDEGFWSTGNGWAAAGMLRVHATIKNSEFADSMKNERKDLEKWVEEIHHAMYSHVDSTHIFANYADQPADSNGNFYDASGTALLAATVFRASTELGKHKYKYVQNAQDAWNALFTTTSSLDQGGNFTDYAHFTQDGWLQPVVNPHSFRAAGSQSPEGQAFVVMLYAAKRDWDNGASGLKVHLGLALSLAAGVILALV